MSNITKRALEDSLKHLLLKKPVNKITINDITEDCGVNRATFYYHFQDIYALIEWSCEEDSRKALSNNTTYDTWQQGFLNILHAVEDNKVRFVDGLPHFLCEAVRIRSSNFFIPRLHGLAAVRAIEQSVEEVIEGTGLSLHDRRPAVDDLLHPVPVFLRDDCFVTILKNLSFLTGNDVVGV